MCFSAAASVGAAAALLPVGGYALATVWRKDRWFLPLAAVPVLFGLQQLCEARVWDGLDHGDPRLARVPALMFLFFALVVWPVWVPLAVAAIVPRGRTRRAILALAAVGVGVAVVYYLPLTTDGGRGLRPAVVGHSIRYDFSAAPSPDWVWLTLYPAVVCGPLLLVRHLRPLGIAVAAGAAASYLVFENAFASVWCFCAAVLSVYLTHALNHLPAETSGPRIPAPAG